MISFWKAPWHFEKSTGTRCAALRGLMVQVETPNPNELPYQPYSGSLPLVSHPQYQHSPKLSWNYICQGVNPYLITHDIHTCWIPGIHSSGRVWEFGLSAHVSARQWRHPPVFALRLIQKVTSIMHFFFFSEKWLFRELTLQKWTHKFLNLDIIGSRWWRRLSASKRWIITLLNNWCLCCKARKDWVFSLE